MKKKYDKVSITSKQDSIKKSAVHFRSLGHDLKDCALLSGISLATLKKYQTADTQFNLDLQSAWAKYKGRLIEKVEDKDPKYLLQNDFPERFAKEKEAPNSMINAFIGYDELAKQLADLIEGVEQRGDTARLVSEAEVVES